MRQRGLFPCPGGGRGACVASGLAVGSFSAVPGCRREPEALGRQRKGAPPVALHLGHGQAPLKKKRAGARPKRAAAGVPLRESLAVFRWRTPADREIAVDGRDSTILPRARQGKSAFADSARPGRFERAGRFRRRSVGAADSRPPCPYPEVRRKSYAGRPERRTRLLRNAILAETLPASYAASRLCGEAVPPESNLGEDRFRPAAKRPVRGGPVFATGCVAKRLRSTPRTGVAKGTKTEKRKRGDRMPGGEFCPLFAIIQIRCTFSEAQKSARKLNS